MAPHSSTLAWKIPWTQEPGGPQSMGSLKVGHNWVTSLSLFTFMHWRRKWQHTPMFLPGESQGCKSLVGWSMGSVRSQSRTWLKQLSSSGSWEKQERSRKTSISPLLTMPKPLTVWITVNCGKFWKRWEYQTTWPASWETCMQVRKQQLKLDMEQQTGSK